MKKGSKVLLATLTGFSLIFSAACGNDEPKEGDAKALTGEVKIDGSSTVFPIMEAVSEEFSKEYSDVKAPVAQSGTGGGFKKFVTGDIDISNASRPIKDEEKQMTVDNKIDYIELPIAYDGLAIIVNKENDWVKDLTTEDLKKMWTENGKTKKWSDINPAWPKKEIKFYAPTTNHGTYDYFDEVILDGEPLAKKATLSEDYNIIVNSVAGDKNGIAFVGAAYYFENESKVNAATINGIEMTNETIKDGSYAPLSRSLLLYVNNASVKNKEQVYEYLKYAFTHGGALAEEVGYIALPQEKYDDAISQLDALKK
ncbi:MAG: PstS family phosphate ABC transporter substrate-binding protein [Bacillaceae bacterium]